MKFIPKELKQTADVSRGSSTFRDHFQYVATVIGVLVGGYLALGWVAEITASSLSDETEARYMKMNIGVIPKAGSNENFDRASQIFQRLLSENSLRRLPYRLVLVDLDGPNAFAVAGGLVGVTPDLLSMVSSEAGLAMVLGHELGHHQKRHCLRRLGRLLTIHLAGSVLLGSSAPSGMDAVLGAAAAHYSRDQEREADAFGLWLVERHIGNTDEALEFFEDILKEDVDDGPWHAFDSSHPLTVERIEYLRNLMKR